MCSETNGVIKYTVINTLLRNPIGSVQSLGGLNMI